MLRVKLREAMESYQRRTGKRMTYELMSNLTGLSRPTIESLASRQTYNTRLSTIAKVCRALQCQPGELLEWTDNDEGSRA